MTMMFQSYTGSQPASARIPTTMNIPIRKKTPAHHAARTKPGRMKMPRGRGAHCPAPGPLPCGVPCSTTLVTDSLLR